MQSKTSLHDKLEAISAKITAARQRIDFRHGLNDKHDLTSGELLARYKYLSEKLNEEAVSLEEQGHRVSALEKDALEWINSVDFRLL